MTGATEERDPAASVAQQAGGSSWPALTADLELLAPTRPLDRPARVAIASYEFNGIVRNGGIGTACTSLALALAADGHDVDMVFTGWAEDPSDEGFEHWRDHYQQRGVALHWLDYETVANWDTVLYNARHSLALYRLLRDRDRERPYDVIHFVESLGHSLYPLLAKRAGVAFQSATTVIGVHSPRRWLAEAHGLPFDHPVELGDEFMEFRSVELADVLVSPSRHMLGWLEGRGVRLPERSYVQQYVTDFDVAEWAAAPANGNDAAPAAPIEELVFFGRLEPRKGLMVFCDALDELADAGVEQLGRVTFLGKQVPFGEIQSGDYLRERAASWPWDCSVIDQLDRDAALEYLGQPGRLAVMASLMDNSPNTVYEAIGLKLAFLASRGGGTAELVHPDDFERVTYEPGDPDEHEIDPGDPGSTRPRHTGPVLAARLREALATVPTPARYAVDPKANREAHIAWHRAVAAGDSRLAVASPAHVPERVDVRELAVAVPEGELVLLFDQDVEYSQTSVVTLAAAAEANPGAAFFTGLGSFDVETEKRVVERVLLPTGGSPPSGLLGNCFGAGIALARVDALERIGQLGPGADGGLATVGDLLARAALTGERIDVVPEVLYNLPARAVPNGALATLQGPLETLRPYHAHLDPMARDIASLAARLLREDAAVRAHAERAEANAAELSQRLAVLLNSRSFRMMAPLRRLGQRARRIRPRRA